MNNNYIDTITVNGKVYKLATELPKELPNLGDGEKDVIFIGLLDKKDLEVDLTYSYLSNLIEKDNVNNKVFEPTTVPITVYTEFKDPKGKYFFTVIPASHPDLYTMSVTVLAVNDFIVKDISLDFPSGNKDYKVFIYRLHIVRMEQDLTYTYKCRK